MGFIQQQLAVDSKAVGTAVPYSQLYNMFQTYMQEAFYQSNVFIRIQYMTESKVLPTSTCITITWLFSCTCHIAVYGCVYRLLALVQQRYSQVLYAPTGNVFTQLAMCLPSLELASSVQYSRTTFNVHQSELGFYSISSYYGTCTAVHVFFEYTVPRDPYVPAV